MSFNLEKRFANFPYLALLFIVSRLKVKTLTLFMDSPVMAYGRYSSRMITVEPEGEKDTTTHDTLGKDKISFDEVYEKAIEMLN